MGSEIRGVFRALIGAALVASGVLCAGIAVAVTLSAITNSGLFGICGPYGEGWSISAQLALIGAAVLGYPFFAVFTFLRLRKQADTSVAA